MKTLLCMYFERYLLLVGKHIVLFQIISSINTHKTKPKTYLPGTAYADGGGLGGKAPQMLIRTK